MSNFNKLKNTDGRGHSLDTVAMAQFEQYINKEKQLKAIKSIMQSRYEQCECGQEFMPIVVRVSHSGFKYCLCPACGEVVGV